MVRPQSSCLTTRDIGYQDAGCLGGQNTFYGEGAQLSWLTQRGSLPQMGVITVSVRLHNSSSQLRVALTKWSHQGGEVPQLVKGVSSSILSESDLKAYAKSSYLQGVQQAVSSHLGPLGLLVLHNRDQ